MEKEYLITKKCDQKDKQFREYQFIRTLKVDEDGFPLNEELQDIVNLEEKNKRKSIAFFIGDNNITMFSYKNSGKFSRKVVTEYVNNSGYNMGIYERVYFSANKKIVDIMEKVAEYFIQRGMTVPENSFKEKSYVRKK